MSLIDAQSRFNQLADKVKQETKQIAQVTDMEARLNREKQLRADNLKRLRQQRRKAKMIELQGINKILSQNIQ